MFLEPLDEINGGALSRRRIEIEDYNLVRS
jgi:hypothetical protein